MSDSLFMLLFGLLSIGIFFLFGNDDTLSVVKRINKYMALLFGILLIVGFFIKLI